MHCCSRQIHSGLLLASFFALLLSGGTASTRASDQGTSTTKLSKEATWDWPGVDLFEQQIASFMDQRGVSEETRAQVIAYWSSSRQADRGPQFMKRLLEVAAIVDPRFDAINRKVLSISSQPLFPGDLPWLTSDAPGWLQDTVRLACGRAAAQRRLYDEALETLSGLSVDQVCDPASLLFYRATCEHNLLMKEPCIQNLETLLARESELPRRYVTLANLMRGDISGVKEDSLDEISRMMRDVQRRLDLGRLGSKVREEEDKIVGKLSKLIKDIEEELKKQQQQSNSQSQQQNGQQRPSSIQPMEDSEIAGQNGAGDVDDKDIGSRAGWGNLPPAQRQESLQRLSEELPSHYRDIIEGYFRELANEKR
ncbi:MAG: hypothetical protein Aurels2KO_48890 [Aureliella sp.]